MTPEPPPPVREVWLKADFHAHSAEDPGDELDYSALELLHRAHELGFGALAITLHDHVLTQPEVFAAARELGVLLIPAAEMRIEGADVVVLNLTEAEAELLKTFADLEALRKKRGDSIFTFAPHPVFVLGGSIGLRRLEEHIACFDAVEHCHFHTAGMNLNRSVVRFAEKFRKPLLATSDAHRLDFFGDHYTFVRAEGRPSAEELFRSIRAGQIRPVSPPWPLRRFLDYLFFFIVTHPVRCLIHKL
jgi:predicted metal-dependent phosphoesterase TrpH